MTSLVADLHCQGNHMLPSLPGLWFPLLLSSTVACVHSVQVTVVLVSTCTFFIPLTVWITSLLLSQCLILVIVPIHFFMKARVWVLIWSLHRA